MKTSDPKPASPADPGALPADVCALIDECRGKPNPASHLIGVLHRLQQRVGYLDRRHLDEVSQRLGVPAAKVSGTATFYHFFTFHPRGRHRVSVCLGTACFVRGAGSVRERLAELLGVGEGEVTPDGQFSFETARCLGACALAPVMVVDERVYGNVKADDVERILAEYGHRPASARAAAIP